MSSLTQAGVNRVPTNAGTAIPSGGSLTIIGAGGITTSASGSTVTITGAGGAGFIATLTGNSGGAISPVANNINILGGTGITISGAGNTLTVSTTGTTVLTYVSVNNAASPYTALASDDYISVDVTAGPVTIRLPNAPVTGRIFIVKDRVGLAATNNITVTTVGGAVNIDGSTSFVMNTAFEAVQVLFNGSAYEIF